MFNCLIVYSCLLICDHFHISVLHILFEAIKKLSAEQSQLTAAVNRMGNMLECLTSEVIHRKREPFEKKYNLQIPFATREDFIRFDEQLANDEVCRTALVIPLITRYSHTLE